MAEIKDFLKRIKLVRRPSSTASKVVLTITIVLCMAALGTLGLAVNRIENQTRELKAKAAAMEQQNKTMVDRIENADSVQGVQDIAEAELDLVDPNTVIYQPES